MQTKTPTTRPSTTQRLYKALTAGLISGLRSCVFLIRLIVPISLAVSMLNFVGILPWLARLLQPLMGVLGLRGEAALVFITSILLNNYSAIAVIQSLEFFGREVAIMAVMCLIAHNMLVETAVMKKLGSSAARMFLLRVGMAIVAAFLLNLIMPARLDLLYARVSAAPPVEFWPFMLGWLRSTAALVLKVVAFVLSIMVVQQLLNEFKVSGALGRIFAPLMAVFGLSRKTAFLWVVINTIGYAYGAAVIMDQVRQGDMKAQEADLFNHHAAISHSLLEDTLLWLAIGVPLFWLILPRLVLSVVVVWLERWRRSHFRQSFRVGTA